ncbi:MAG: hypothetical protein E7481_08430 [Ruminococcaceae bacterium]|nr:hypothetical protein [Oscillospiraceae bacterium]
MKLKTKLAAFALAVTCSFGVCAHAATEVPKLLPFLNTDSAAVVAMIDSITIADLTTERQIEEAFIAYCDLEDSAKAKVTNYEKLDEMRKAIAKLYNPDAENKQGGKLIDRSQFLIGVYNVNSQCWTDEHFQAIKDCNIDVICSGSYNTTFLDLCEKYGIGTYVNYLPHFFVGSVEARGSISQFCPLGTYQSYAENFVDHPAIVGFAIADEPHLWDYEHLELLRQEAAELFPDKLIYINLLPSGQHIGAYGVWERNDTDYDPTYDYYRYIEDYEKIVQTDYISYDLYMLSFENFLEKDGRGGLHFLEAAATLGDITSNTGKDYWFVPQVSSSVNDIWVTTQQLRYQVYNSMAYGVKAINWACWTAGWWHADNQVVDSAGNFTQQYEKLKTVNNEIKTLSPIYMRYTNKDTYIASQFPYFNDYNSSNIIPKHIENTFNQNVIKDITASESSTVIIGYFEKNIGNGTAFMISNATDFACGEDYDGKIYLNEGQDAKVTFKLVDSNAEVTAYLKNTAYKLTPDENGVYSISVPNGEGIFVTIDPITAE